MKRNKRMFLCTQQDYQMEKAVLAIFWRVDLFDGKI